MTHSGLKLKNLIAKVGIDPEKAIALSDGGTDLKHEFDIRPEEFLQFSENDISDNEPRGLVNGLSNAKRAIDSQVDEVIRCLLIRPEVLKQPKLEILSDLGLVAPRILRRIRDSRNLLEHEYRLPTKQQVEDAIDVATLFVTACRKTFFLFPDVVVIANEDEESDPVFLFKKRVLITTDWDEKGFIVVADAESWERAKNAKSMQDEGKAPAEIRKSGDYMQVRNDDLLYYRVLRLFVAAHTGDYVRKPLEFFEGHPH